MAARRRARRSRRSKQPPANDGSFEGQTRWLPILVFAISLFVFLPTVGNDFVNWDDDRNFLDNSSYRGLSFENLKWMFTTFHLGHYHPLTWLTLGLDYVFWGMNPSGYHLTNAVLHAATSWLVYLVIVQLLQLARREEEPTPALLFSAALGALLFAIHPLRVESVAWASERRDVLSGLFYVGSALLYLRGRLWASVGVFAAALLSKVMVASLPIVLLVLDIYPLRRKFDLGLLWSKIPYFALAMAAGLFALAQQRTGVAGTFEDIQVEPLLRLTLSLSGLAFYLWKSVFPFSLAPQYAYSSSPQAFDVPLIVGSVVAVAVTIASLLLRRRWPALPAAWACYVITLLPVLSILRFDPQQYVADHHSYLATMAFAALAAGGFSILLERRRTALAAACAAVVTLVLCERTLAQTRVWENSVTLWTHTLNMSPLSSLAHNNLGRALASQGQTDKALEHLRTAVEIRPDYAHAHYNLGYLLMQQGELQKAEFHFRRAIEKEPRYAAAQTSLGNCLVRQNREAEAEEHYQVALEVLPDFADAHYNFALALHRQSKLGEAARHYQLATRFDPTNADAHSNWGVLLESQGRAQDAIRHYRRALQIDPSHPDAQRNLKAAESRSEE